MQVEVFDEFCERMACPYLGSNKGWLIGPNNRRGGFLFENGGFSDGLYMHIAPPTEPVPLAIMRRQYYARLLQQAEVAFKNLKLSAVQAARNTGKVVPSIGLHHVKQLEQMRDRVVELRKHIAAFDETLSNSEEAKAKRARAEEEAEAYANRMDLADAVLNIEI